jgi:hypothetical protein
MTLFATALIVVMLVRTDGLFGERELFEKKADDGTPKPPKNDDGTPAKEALAS